MTVKHFLYPCITRTLLKAYLLQFILPCTLCMAIKEKKSQDMVKTKQHSLKRHSKDKNQTQA